MNSMQSPDRVALGDGEGSAPQIELSSSMMWGLVDSAPDGLLMVDDAGLIMLVNRRIEELFGWARGDLIGQTIEQLLPVEARQIHLAHRTRYSAEPDIRPMGVGRELQGRRRDGVLFPVEISLSPLQGDNGHSQVIAAVRDISDRVAAEAADAEIRHGLNLVEDGVFMFDSETLQFTYVNQGAVDQVGYTEDELLRMTPLHLKPRFTDSSLRELIAPLIADKTPSVHLTTVHRAKDGTDIPVEIVLQAPVPGAFANKRSCVALVRDIRNRLEAEQELASVLQHAALVADRERVARDLHDNVIQELFATGMGLEATASTIDQPETVERVVHAIDSIDRVIKQIRGTIFELRSQERAEHGVRHQILTATTAAVDALGFEPSVSFLGPVDGLPQPVVDHLTSIVREALSNTARHSLATAVEVTLTVTDERVELSVIDNGVGISGATVQEGRGLRNMHERAVSLGGGCEVAVAQDGGTRVLWRIPHHPASSTP